MACGGFAVDIVAFVASEMCSVCMYNLFLVKDTSAFNLRFLLSQAVLGHIDRLFDRLYTRTSVRGGKHSETLTTAVLS